jgi:hypothetical protein
MGSIGNRRRLGEPGPGFRVINKFGRNLNVDTADTPITVWAHGATGKVSFPFLDAGVEMDFKSTLAADDIAGTGAQKIRITFYDDSNVEFVQEFETDGVTPVQLPGLIKMVSRIEVTQVGSDASKTNVGEINVVDRATGLVVYQSLEIGDGQTFSAVQMVPAGKKGIIKEIFTSYAKRTNKNDADLSFRIRRSNGATVIKHISTISAAKPDNGKDYKIGGIEMEAGDIAYWQVDDVSANDTPLFADFDMEIEDV